MNKILCLLSVCLTSSAFAGEPSGERRKGPMNEQTFEAIKQRVVQTHKARLHVLQGGQACLEAAQKPDDIRACAEKEKQAMKAMLDEQKGHRKVMREKHQGAKTPSMP